VRGDVPLLPCIDMRQLVFGLILGLAGVKTLRLLLICCA
jgi:hypothetical protein